MHKLLGVLFFAMGLSSVAKSESPLLMAQGRSDVLEIVAARRALAYGTGTGELLPPSPEDVILVVRVRGIPDDQWSAGEIYVTSGEAGVKAVRRMRLSGTDERVVVFIIPSSMKKLALLVKGRPPVPFETPDTIVNHIMLR